LVHEYEIEIPNDDELLDDGSRLLLEPWLISRAECTVQVERRPDFNMELYIQKNYCRFVEFIPRALTAAMSIVYSVIVGKTAAAAGGEYVPIRWK